MIYSGRRSYWTFISRTVAIFAVYTKCTYTGQLTARVWDCIVGIHQISVDILFEFDEVLRLYYFAWKLDPEVGQPIFKEVLTYIFIASLFENI